MKNQSLATQFRRTIILIITASIVATALTYVLAFYLFTQSKDIYPANYYEQQIPGIETYIREKNSELLFQANEVGLKGMFRGNGILYQVVDSNGNILYGTNLEKLFVTKEELLNSFLNTTVFRQGYYIRTVPIMNAGGETAGAVLLSYQIKTTFANSRGQFVFGLLVATLFSPFFYIIGFTQLFSKCFAKSINEPLQRLITASKKIKEKDLDFEIDYHSDNELGKLCAAFCEMKEELKNSLSAQWKMEQERVEMVEALAHDLKSPLSIILAYTDALIENKADNSKKLCRYLAVIKENAGKSAALVQQMQYTSDIEKSTALLHLTSVNLPEFLKKKVQHYELQTEQRGIEITMNAQGDMSKPVAIDVEKLERILDNIVSNSMQFVSEGGKITISAKADTERICYEVCNSVLGFSEKDKKKAFDKFYRGDEARQSKGGHSGLGLYIVKQLVMQLGGNIEIRNTECGACVMFWHKKVS